MTQEQIQEQLSNRFIGVLAANKGFKIDKPDQDEGVDYILSRPYHYVHQGKTRHTTDGKYIDIQLKSTTYRQIIDDTTEIKYDLEVKNYNDMVDRMQNGIAPLIMILFIFPDDRNTWVEVDLNELRVRRMAYWYKPPTGASLTNNNSTIRITIPKVNVLGIDCFDTLHGQFYP